MRRFSVDKTLPLRLTYIDLDNNLIDARVFKIKYNLVTEAGEEDHLVTMQLNQNISVTKINFFLENYLNNSLVMDVDYRDKIFSAFAEYENNFVILPDITESTLMECIHAKLNALCKPGSRVDRVELFDSLIEVNYTFISTEPNEYLLPEDDEWLAPYRFWNKPWWKREDPSTFDNAASSAEELADWRIKAQNADSEAQSMKAFDEIEQMVTQSFHQAMEQAGIMQKVERGQIIEVDFVNPKPEQKKGRWTPTII